MKYQRMCIYAKDVSIILDKSIQQSRRILSIIRDIHGKLPHQYVSIKEFAAYTGLDEEEIRKVCNL